jgi:hypothetical protein
VSRWLLEILLVIVADVQAMARAPSSGKRTAHKVRVMRYRPAAHDPLYAQLLRCRSVWVPRSFSASIWHGVRCPVLPVQGLRPISEVDPKTVGHPQCG